MSASDHAFEQEIASGKRFRFGENWGEFLELLDERRIMDAERSLTEMLGEGLRDKSFLDIGSGSGLFSLAARRLGARVHSVDFDPSSVECTSRLKRRFFDDDPNWSIERASVLDDEFMTKLPLFDVVYSWGVLHHTGQMYKAITNALERVKPGGLTYLALYRKTWLCPLWKVEKRAYCAVNPQLQRVVRGVFGASLGVAYRLRHPSRQPPRGMDYERDVHDWLGGYPYESVTPRELKAFVERHGFTLLRQTIKSEGVHITPGCDEYVFRRVAE